LGQGQDHLLDAERMLGRIKVGQLDYDGVTITVYRLPGGFLGLDEPDDEPRWEPFEVDPDNYSPN
jgi:hypothetical protein